jgi:hypothetical protein
VVSSTLDGMTQTDIAWVAHWAAAHDGHHRLFAERGDVVVVGRDLTAEIRLGASPVLDERVPRRWLELSWHRGAVIVENHSRASIDLAVFDRDGDTVVERQTVPAGFRGASASPSFTVLLEVPAIADAPPSSWQILIRTSPAARPANLVYEGADPVETVAPLYLTAREKTLGSALVRPLLEGRSARAPLNGIVRATDIPRSTVQRTISDLDLRFLMAGLAVPAHGDQYDRVAYVLRRHQHFLR